MNLPSISLKLKRLAELEMPVEALKALLCDLAVELDTEEARLSKDRERQLVRQKRMGVSSADWKSLRDEVCERDNYTCQYCGSDSDTVDHVIPLAAGGATTPDNLVAACRHCNSSKNDRPVTEWEATRCS